MAHAVYSNMSAPATLAADITAAATSITLQSGGAAKLPTITGGNYIWATLFHNGQTIGGPTEIVKITNVVGEVLTVVRGQQGTTAQAYYLNDKLEVRVTASGFTDIETEIAAVVPYTGATSDVDLNNKHLVNVSHLAIGTTLTPDILLRVVGDNGSLSRASVRGYSNNAASSAIRVTKYRGTEGTPLVVNNADSLGMFQFAGYSAITADGVSGAYIEAVATEGWTTTANGTKLLIKVCANGAAGPTTAITINQDKTVTFAGQVTANVTGTASIAATLNTNKVTVASAATPDIFAAAGNTIDYTGTSTCTGFVAAPQAGMTRKLICAGACFFTTGANLIIEGVPSGVTVPMQANAIVDVVALTTTSFKLTYSLSGTYIATGTGFAANPTTTASYKVQNGWAQIYIPLEAISGTSNATSLTVTGAPDVLKPAATRNLPLSWGVDNTSTNVSCLMNVNIFGVINVIPFTAGLAWTASGTKKMEATEISYSLF